MSLQTIDQGVVSRLGHYADAVVIPAGHEQILVSGMPGIDQDGEIRSDITGQSEQAWENVTRVLAAAGASIDDIVFVRQWVTDESYVDDYVAVRTRYVTRRPASTLAVVSALSQPGFLVELEVVAARAPQGPEEL